MKIFVFTITALGGLILLAVGLHSLALASGIWSVLFACVILNNCLAWRWK
jgi:hypothetical protein